MGQTAIIEQSYEEFNINTGEIHKSTKRTTRKSPIGPTDEFVKVSKYLNTVFAYKGIPLSLVGISLILAQRMEFRTNIVYLLKSDKVEIGDMLGLSRRYRKIKGQQTNIPDTNTVDKLIRDCVKYDIIRPTQDRGKYEVNSYLFSTGSIADTRELQAHFDFDDDTLVVGAIQKNKITGEVIRKAVANKKNATLAIPGQLSMFNDPEEK